MEMRSSLYFKYEYQAYYDSNFITDIMLGMQGNGIKAMTKPQRENGKKADFQGDRPDPTSLAPGLGLSFSKRFWLLWALLEASDINFTCVPSDGENLLPILTIGQNITRFRLGIFFTA